MTHAAVCVSPGEVVKPSKRKPGPEEEPGCLKEIGSSGRRIS
jgi:hypothetical protein